MYFILRSKGGNYLCLRDFQGEPQYYLSTSEGAAKRYSCLAHAVHGALLGADCLGLKITFKALTVGASQGGAA